MILASTELDAWLDYVQRGGVLAILILIVWALLREYLVPGSIHRRLLQEERTRTAEWRELAEGALERIERAVAALNARRR